MDELQENLDKIEEETIKEIQEQFRFESRQSHLENVLITSFKSTSKIIIERNKKMKLEDDYFYQKFIEDNFMADEFGENPRSNWFDNIYSN
jgi:hypothetical protein